MKPSRCWPIRDIQFLGGATLDQIVRGLAQNGIVDEYDSGNWHVVKYANGEAELFYKQGDIIFKKASSWGYSYYTDTLTLQFPITLKSIEFANGVVSGTQTFAADINTLDTNNLKYKVVSYSHDWTTQQAGVLFYIRGKYK